MPGHDGRQTLDLRLPDIIAGHSSEKESTVGYANRWTAVRVEVDEGIAWVELNRPEKRNERVTTS